MRIGDVPEYLISIGALCALAKVSRVPTTMILGGVSLALTGAIFLHRPVQRFRYMWRLTFFSWGCVLAYSRFTQFFVPNCHWGLMPAGYVGVLAAFYLWHIIAHQTWSGRMYRVHMIHHMKLYPPKRFLSDKPLPSHSLWSLDGLCHQGPLFGLVLSEILLLRYLFKHSMKVRVDNKCIYFMVAGLALFGHIGNVLHISFHIRGHWLERYKWFLMCRELHWVHHKGDMKKNYMLVDFGMDELFSSKDYVRFINDRKAGTMGIKKQAVDFV